MQNTIKLIYFYNIIKLYSTKKNLNYQHHGTF